MSEPEKKTGESGGTLVVDKAESDQHKPYRPTELHEETSTEPHKRSRAPAIPSLVEDLKITVITETPATCEHADQHSEKHFGKKLFSNKRKGTPPENIAMVLMDAKKENVTLPAQPIPPHVDAVASEASSLKSAGKTDARKKADEDSITEEVDIRTAEAAKDHSEWSDDEEAGGLPRSESRASRVSRAVRQLFCCGVTYNAPSEENITPRAMSGI